jgi:hypothetical protein
VLFQVDTRITAVRRQKFSRQYDNQSVCLIKGASRNLFKKYVVACFRGCRPDVSSRLQ